MCEPGPPCVSPDWSGFPDCRRFLLGRASALEELAPQVLDLAIEVLVRLLAGRSVDQQVVEHRLDAHHPLVPRQSQGVPACVWNGHVCAAEDLLAALGVGRDHEVAPAEVGAVPGEAAAGRELHREALHRPLGDPAIPVDPEDLDIHHLPRRVGIVERDRGAARYCLARPAQNPRRLARRLTLSGDSHELIAREPVAALSAGERRVVGENGEHDRHHGDQHDEKLVVSDWTPPFPKRTSIPTKNGLTLKPPGILPL